MSAQINGGFFTEQTGDSRDNTGVCFFLLWSPFRFPQTHCRHCCWQCAYLMLVDPTAVGIEIGLCQPVVPAGWCCPGDPEAASMLCWLRRAKFLTRGWAEVSWWVLGWHCCIHCLSSWLGVFRHLILWFLFFQGLAATPITDAGEGVFGGDGIRQWFGLENTALSWACDEPETGREAQWFTSSTYS